MDTDKAHADLKAEISATSAVVAERRRCLDIIQKEINKAIDDGETSLYWGRLAEVKARILSGEQPERGNKL